MGKAEPHSLRGLPGRGKGLSLCEQVQGLRAAPRLISLGLGWTSARSSGDVPAGPACLTAH